MYNYNYYNYQLLIRENNKLNKQYNANMNNFCYLCDFYIN